MKQFIAAFIFTLGWASASIADDTPVDAWFKALRTADKAALENIISADARIFLKQRQIVQSKDEFIASMHEWKEVSEGLELSFDADRRGANEIVTQVCYRFPSNAFTNLETFVIEEGKITLQVQEKQRDGC